MLGGAGQHDDDRYSMIRAGRWCCVAGAGIGALGVLAWLVGVGPLTAIIPGQPPMMPNTALGLLLLGVGGALRAPSNPGWAKHGHSGDLAFS